MPDLFGYDFVKFEEGPSMRKFLIALLTGSAFAGSAVAADLLPGEAMCRVVGPSKLLTIESNAQLTDEVVRLMTEAVNVADSEEWISSRAHAFNWASEAKVACGKAYGYLRNDYRDEDYLNKCECFHQRMISYMY